SARAGSQHRGNDPGLQVDSSDGVTLRIHHVKIAVGSNSQSLGAGRTRRSRTGRGPAEFRAQRRTTVTAITRFSRARDTMQRLTIPVDPINRITLAQRDVQIA